MAKKNKIIGLTGLDTRSLTNYIRDFGAPKGTISHNKKGNFNFKKLNGISSKWHGLNGLDLAETVTTTKKYLWKGFKDNKHGTKPKVILKIKVKNLKLLQ